MLEHPSSFGYFVVEDVQITTTCNPNWRGAVKRPFDQRGVVYMAGSTESPRISSIAIT